MSVRRSYFMPVLFFLFAAVLCFVALALGYARNGDAASASLPSAGETSFEGVYRVVVIDAGHGGEDGGAVSAAGAQEKNINLAVATALRDLLEANGIPTVMTRTEDKLLYDPAADYKGRKKALDLAARREIAEATREALFVSIHMNAFPQTQYSGTQVWYGTKDGRSQELAAAVQSAVQQLQPDNDRKIKPAGSNIYLLDRLEMPAILVECGFLSNPAEAERLCDETYQKDIAFAVFAAIAPFAED